MRISAIGYGYLNNELLIRTYGIKCCDRILCDNISKFKDNGFRLFYTGGVV